MLAVSTVESIPGSGSEIASSSREPSFDASSSLAISSATTMNSSPPKRPTKSLLRTAVESRSPTSRIISSARSWPSVSFNVLSPSRSTNRTATDEPGSVRTSASSSDSKIAVRFGSPLSPSWRAS